MSDPRVFNYRCECGPNCSQTVLLRHHQYLSRTSGDRRLIARACAFQATLGAKASA